jgi:glycosyltransferase involved in cell wall biosynthesis
MRVQLIGQPIGGGVPRDITVLEGALRACGCEVVVTAIDPREPHGSSWLNAAEASWRPSGRRGRAERDATSTPFDLNVMLEHVWPDYFGQARRTVAVPNPEWFDGRDVRALSSVDGVWAKTADTERIFRAMGARVCQIGFDSEDRYDAAVPRERVFFHLAGYSPIKGTGRLVEVWRRHPDWPRLTVVAHFVDGTPAPPPSTNVDVISTYVDEGDLRRLQNRSLFHVCPSEAEGWGHYIAEAMSVGALTITVDAPPMNELVTRHRGLLVGYTASQRQKLGERYQFDERALEASVEAAIGMPVDEAAALGTAARRWFAANKAGFTHRVRRALDAISKPSG